MGVGFARVLTKVLGDLWVVGPARLHWELDSSLLKWLPDECHRTGGRV